MTVELLPDNTFAIMRSVDAVNAARRPLPAWLIKLVDDPWTCPEALLGYCAYHYSVDLWDDDWPVAKKRSVIAESIKLARIKGTEAAISRAVEIMGGVVKDVIAPPNTLYLSISRTPEERAAWLAKMPQLRIYPKRMPHQVHGIYVGGYFEGYTLTSDAELYATPRVTLWRRGQPEQELVTLEKRRLDPTITEAEESIEARQPHPVHGFYVGKPFEGPLMPSMARETVYRIRTRVTLAIPGRDEQAVEIARPSMVPIDVRPETVREPHAVTGLWCGGCQLGFGVSKHLVPSQARLHVFKRIYLLDPEVPARAFSGRTFLGYNFRFGQEPFTAEYKVEIAQRLPAAAYWPFTYGFLVDHDRRPRQRVVEAIRTHQALRDRIILNTHTRDVDRAGPGFVAGDQAIAGRIVAV